MKNRETNSILINDDISSLASDFSKDNELYENEIKEFERILSKEKKLRKELKAEQKALVVYSKPDMPESYVGSVAAWTFGISGVLVLVFFILHIIIWILNLIFNIRWDSWGFTKHVFCWGVILSSFATLVAFLVYKIQMGAYESNMLKYENYKKEKSVITSAISKSERKTTQTNSEINRIHQIRRDVLVHCIKNTLCVPIPIDGSLPEEEYPSLKERYFDLLSLKQKAEEFEAMSKYSKDYLDQKLLFFYQVSMRKGINNDTVYAQMTGEVEKCVEQNDLNGLRQESPVVNKLISEGVPSLASDRSFLLSHNDPIKGYIKEFKHVLENTDTSGLFGLTSTSKQKERNKELYGIVNSAKQHYNQLKPISDKLDNLLQIVRACAYRNLYLGVELIKKLF